MPPLEPYFQDEFFTLYQGDSMEVMRKVDEQINCVVTSPPYYGLRDYGTGYWEGGSDECGHESARKKTRYDYSMATSPKQTRDHPGTDAQPAMYTRVCPDCSAERVDSQLGLEETVEEYIDRLVALFVTMGPRLKPSATLWVNLGDSFIDRELTGIPWLFAFTMKEFGFTLLADCIWNKPNAMPTSQKHRPTIGHEYVFMFSVGENYYGYEDVKERMAPSSMNRMKAPRIGANNNKGSSGQYGVQSAAYSSAEKDGWRNMRNVWEIATETFPGAHYAIYPRALVERCIKAGCPEGGLVCDPFMGSGTTAAVARNLNRRCLGIELKPEYCHDAVLRYQGRNLLLEEAGQISFFDQEVDPDLDHAQRGHRLSDDPTPPPSPQDLGPPATEVADPQEGSVGGQQAGNPWRIMAVP